MPSKLLNARLTPPFIALNPVDAQNQKATDGMTVNIDVENNLAPVTVIIDQHVPTGFALVPRSSELPIMEPTEIKIRIAETIKT